MTNELSYFEYNSKETHSVYIMTTVIVRVYQNGCMIRVLDHEHSSLVNLVNWPPGYNFAPRATSSLCFLRAFRDSLPLSRHKIRFFEAITEPKFRRGETGLTRDSPATFSAAFEVSSGANLIT